VCGVCMTAARRETRRREKISSRLHSLRREECAGRRGSWHMAPVCAWRLFASNFQSVTSEALRPAAMQLLRSQAPAFQ
jgi:hypothetical protein